MKVDVAWVDDWDAENARRLQYNIRIKCPFASPVTAQCQEKIVKRQGSGFCCVSIVSGSDGIPLVGGRFKVCAKICLHEHQQQGTRLTYSQGVLWNRNGGILRTRTEELVKKRVGKSFGRLQQYLLSHE